MITLRFCKPCNQEKVETEFPYDKRWKKHWGSKCSDCLKRSKRKNPNEDSRFRTIRDADGVVVEKVCRQCNTCKPVSEFNKSTKSTGYQPICKSCKKKNLEAKTGIKFEIDSTGKLLARTCTKCKIHKQASEFRADSKRYLGHYNECFKCESERSSEIYRKYIEHNKKYRRDYYKQNAPQIKLRVKAYRKENQKKLNIYMNVRDRDKRQRTLTKHFAQELRAIYSQCKQLTKETGIEYTVDHIVPLNNPNVSGLHVPWNVQFLTKSENSKKNNKFDGTYENETWRAEL